MSGLTIEQMNLDPLVKLKAQALRQSAPGVVFLSGRRTLEDQARAMAGNVMQNRQYIKNTYASSVASRELQTWIDDHPEAGTAESVAAGLLSVLRALPFGQASQISRHLTGRAFDLEPGSCTIAQVLALRPRLFLTHEAGLVRWHCQW